MKDLLSKIASAYENGGQLTDEMVTSLKEAFARRDAINKLFSIDIVDSPEKMKELLEKDGYTVSLVQNLKFAAEGTDAAKLNVFVAAMNGNVEEFYVASAVYFERMATEHLDSAMTDSKNKCIAKLVAKGYSEEKVIKAISDYSATGQFNLTKGKVVQVRLVKRSVPSVAKKPEKKVDEGIADIDKGGNPEQSLPDSTVVVSPQSDLGKSDSLSDSELDALVMQFYQGNHELIPPALEHIYGGAGTVSDQGEDSASEDVSELNIIDSGKGVSDDTGSKDGEFIQPDNSSENRFLGQGVNPFDPSYSAQEIGTQPSESDPFLGEPDEEMPNPFEVPQEGLFKKIVKKVKRPISKPDFTKLKKSMLNSLSRLMQKASNALQAKVDLGNDISDELPSHIGFDDSSKLDGDEKGMGK